MDVCAVASSTVGLPFILNFVELCIFLLLPMISLITFQKIKLFFYIVMFSFS